MRKEDFTPEQLKVLDHLLEDFKNGVLAMYQNPDEFKEPMFNANLNPDIIDIPQRDEILVMLMEDIDTFKENYDFETCETSMITGLKAHLANYVLGDEPKEFSEIYIVIENAYYKRKHHD